LKTMPEAVHPLPIDSLLPSLKSSLQKNPNLVVVAAPGTGKTTRIPPALLDPAISKTDEIWVLEPRRIAARLSAQRVAEELGERLGETVGYQVRFEEISSPRTRLRFLTEGVFTRRLLSNPTLKGVAAVVLDEFHERHLQTDLALALLRRLQQSTRPDLKLIVMSATLDAAPLARYLGDCPTLRSEGRRFDISIEFLKQEDSRPLAEQVAAALRKLIAAKIDGDVLVFLPGAAEIRRARETCSEIAARENLMLALLHGELSTGEQNRALLPVPQRKVILSTNVAETSITIDGVVAVIDSGLARIAEHSPWSGLPTLPVQRISQASAIQRAGRAGRTREGTCLRLFTEMDFNTRRAFETPEIQRLDLAGAALELHAAGVQDLTQFCWFESPNEQSVIAADELLQKLGAIHRTGVITPLGEKMLRYPLHPRTGRLLLEAEAQGVGSRGALTAVLINERNLRTQNVSAKSRTVLQTTGESDVSEREELFRTAQQLQFNSSALLEHGINPGPAKAIDRAYKQLMRLLKQPAADNATNVGASDEQIRIAILAGYPDRVAKFQESDNILPTGSALVSRMTLKFANGTSCLPKALCEIQSIWLLSKRLNNK
jgi:ATP-dependent helicase HrpB